MSMEDTDTEFSFYELTKQKTLLVVMKSELITLSTQPFVSHCLTVMSNSVRFSVWLVRSAYCFI